MVYEYDLTRTDDDKDNKVQPIVSIEIPFGTIVGLKVCIYTLPIASEWRGQSCLYIFVDYYGLINFKKNEN